MSYENAPATKMLATHCAACRKRHGVERLGNLYTYIGSAPYDGGFVDAIKAKARLWSAICVQLRWRRDFHRRQGSDPG